MRDVGTRLGAARADLAALRRQVADLAARAAAVPAADRGMDVEAVVELQMLARRLQTVESAIGESAVRLGGRAAGGAALDADPAAPGGVLSPAR